MTAADKEHDWDKEMAEVDRLLQKLPNAEPALGAGAAPTVRKPAVVVGGAGAGSAAVRSAASGRVGTWTRVGLGLLIGIGMTQWPYTHGCGLQLLLYAIGVVAVIAAGTWSSLSSWKHRLGVAHVLSQGLIIWGLVLAAREVLPRVGYAKTAASWMCHGAPVPPH